MMWSFNVQIKPFNTEKMKCQLYKQTNFALQVGPVLGNHIWHCAKVGNGG